MTLTEIKPRKTNMQSEQNPDIKSKVVCHDMWRLLLTCITLPGVLEKGPEGSYKIRNSKYEISILI